MKKLTLTNEGQAFRLLGEYAGLYGDNSGYADGNAWLPSDQDDIPAEVAQKVIDAGYGHMVEVRMATDEGMVNFLNEHTTDLLGLRVKLANDEFDDDDAERVKEAANEAGLRWAHYGAYGAGDSHWVFISEQ